jgi:PqqD family protein of HPr-rel-A system
MTSITPDQLTPGDRPSPSPAALLMEAGDAQIVFDRASGGVHVLNPTGALVWQVLDGQGTIDEIAADISEVFGIERAEALEQVSDLARQLGTAGLLRDVAPAWPPLPRPTDDCDDDAFPVQDPFRRPPYLAVPPND